MWKSLTALSIILTLPAVASAQEEHQHKAPEHLGTVHFRTSCAAVVQPAFERAVALLHSFAYDAADAGFADVLAHDGSCAIAHWGRAMSHYHQLWEVPAGAALSAGAAEIQDARTPGRTSQRERSLIQALGAYYADAGTVPATVRANRYSDAMGKLSSANALDDEIATFYALSLIATAPPTDVSHARQKRAADILEPIWRRHPDHPGVPHYLIHAYDSSELAQRGLPAARAYAKIAPSAPHALHMPSHIFTRLGLWQDSITSNLAAREAALAEHDVGEALHAMDYLTYAYLQLGRDGDAAKIIAELKTMSGLSGAGFKIGYAGNAMPVRLAVETENWAEAATLMPMSDSSPQVAALVWWARALGKLRAATPIPAEQDIAEIEKCRDALRAAKDNYWASQSDTLLKSAQGWQAAAAGHGDEAVRLMTAAAEEEERLEKLPLTPGPIVPAREQLGQLLLTLDRPVEALAAFGAASSLAPGRRGATQGAAQARRLLAKPA